MKEWCLLLVLVGCTTNLVTQGQQAKWLLQSGNADYVGHVNGNFEMVGKHGATSTAGGSELKFAGIHDGVACVTIDSSMQFQRVFNSMEEVVAKRLAAVKEANLVFIAQDKLDTSDTAGFPPALPNQTEARVTRQKIVRGKTYYLRYDPKPQHSDDLDTTIEVCSPAPTITASTRYLTAISYRPNGSTPHLFVWVVDGRAEARPGPATAAGPVAPQTPTAPDVAPPIASGKGNVIEVLKAAGHYSKFLEALAATGVDATLAAGGPYTVFAPTDEAFAKLSPPQLEKLFEDKEELKQLVLFHVLPGVHASADLDKGDVRIRTLSGKNVWIRPKDGSYHVGTGDASKTAIAATNGIIFPASSIVFR